MNLLKIALLASIVPLCLLNALGADSLVTYREFEEDGNGNPITAPTTLHETLAATDIEIVPAGNITLGDTHAESWESPLPYLQSRSGWDSEDPAGAKAFTFSLSADESAPFTLHELRFEDRATGAGPSAATVSINGTVVFARDIQADTTEQNAVDLSPFDLTGLTSAEFVFAGWDNESRSTSGGGDWRLAGFGVEGTAGVIPEPSVYALLTALLALAPLLARKRFASVTAPVRRR
jgi:hypothetical protein